ncbi:MAG: hypothetical protein ACRDEA_19940, partial [Microcystaceae cyanobacterium]
LEVRADGLWRVPYLKEEFRSPNLESARRLGVAEKSYPKLTFYKEHLATPAHTDAINFWRSLARFSPSDR